MAGLFDEANKDYDQEDDEPELQVMDIMEDVSKKGKKGKEIHCLSDLPPSINVQIK